MNTIEIYEKLNGFEFTLKKFEPEILKKDVCVVYLHGQAGRMHHHKATQICKMCQEQGIRFCCYELSGHANNLEKYDQVDMFDWVNQLKYILNNHIHGKVILIGSCLGGMISLLTAEKYPDSIAGIIGIGTIDIDWKKHLSKTELKELEDNGYTFHCMGGHPLSCKLTKKFITSTEQIRPTSLELNIPIHLLFGLQDSLVTIEEITNFQKKIKSPEVIFKLISNSGHSMRDVVSMREVASSLEAILKKC